MVNANIDYAPETCAWCKGSGRRWGKCPICGGQGSILVAQPPRICAQCKGTGQKWGRCSSCGGTGWAHTYGH